MVVRVEEASGQACERLDTCRSQLRACQAHLPLPSRLLKRVASRSPPGDLLNLRLPLATTSQPVPPPRVSAYALGQRVTVRALLGGVKGQPLLGVSSL